MQNRNSRWVVSTTQERNFENPFLSISLWPSKIHQNTLIRRFRNERENRFWSLWIKSYSPTNIPSEQLWTYWSKCLEQISFYYIGSKPYIMESATVGLFGKNGSEGWHCSVQCRRCWSMKSVIHPPFTAKCKLKQCLMHVCPANICDTPESTNSLKLFLTSTIHRQITLHTFYVTWT